LNLLDGGRGKGLRNHRNGFIGGDDRLFYRLRRLFEFRSCCGDRLRFLDNRLEPLHQNGKRWRRDLRDGWRRGRLHDPHMGAGLVQSQWRTLFNPFGLGIEDPPELGNLVVGEV
jgi:hypothetical protein